MAGRQVIWVRGRRGAPRDSLGVGLKGREKAVCLREAKGLGEAAIGRAQVGVA